MIYDRKVFPDLPDITKLDGPTLCALADELNSIFYEKCKVTLCSWISMTK